MTVRTYQNGDEQQIQDLYEKVFRKKRSHKTWEWKFQAHPNTLNPFILVYEDKGTLLGHLALWVADAYINGVTEKIALRVDTMVDPDAQGQGIYRQLNDAMLTIANEQGVNLLYGFPAVRAKELLLRTTNAVHAGDVARHRMIVDPAALAASVFPKLQPARAVGKWLKNWKLRHAKRDFLPEGWEFREVTTCDEQFDELAVASQTLKPVILKRDAAYLEWRYLHHPEKTYRLFALTKQGQLQGYVVLKTETVPFKKGQAVIGNIVDFLAADDDASIWQLLTKGALANLTDADIIQLWTTPETTAAQMFARHGLKETDRPMPLVVHDLDANTGIHYSDWWLTQGDVDSF
ncbi:GNAT family N-acetyltransferase [Lentibacillus cibarius]|uniref:GNAT family N-acetyltransferase n=1 Tax=Lentibacillus cibarius TaxID=2583219 RepID=A0A549YFU9_9BACI|nr:GNAT family N-acetyltransferase [Lentibacillus cibarius]TRM10717.1 GNAT family N-acetyltransferase [Lentibacillus cibarius]